MTSADRIHALLAAWAVAASLLLAAAVARIQAHEVSASPPPELASYMGQLQHHTHKLTLSVVAQNPELADFYLHEVSEVAEEIERVFPEHDGAPIAALVEQLLEPRIRALRDPIDDERWKEARAGLSDLVAGCNACHAAAGHGFIHVEVTDANPFNQDFGRRD